MSVNPSAREWPRSPGPFVLQPRLQETLWGGQRLATHAHKTLPQGAAIGETWETALEATALNAPYAGASLGELTAHYGERLLGARAVEVFGLRFPLLAKFIDAQQQLSVQVHPDDAYAARHEGGKLGKTETWYILAADPGARLVFGMARATTRAEVAQAIHEQRLEALLRSFEVAAGDVLLVPAGTVHAIGAGVVLFELQEYSDVTYRLYDYGRLQADGQPRALHVEQALAVMEYGPAALERAVPVPLPADLDLRGRILSACRYFVLEELLLDDMASAQTTPWSCQIITVLSGACRLVSSEDAVRLAPGQTVVLPASLGIYTLEGHDTRLLRAEVPRADDPRLLAWRAAQRVAGE